MSARLPLTLVACASVLALSACKDNQAPAPAAPYDFASAPPAAIDAASYAGYAPAERAYAFDRATYRTAPSYGFQYGEYEPWAWRTADDYSMYAEPYDDGYRNYYYAPGADYPYFVRDDDYGYGYGPDGALIAVYDSYGVLLPQDRLYALAALAGAYLVRASAVRRYGLDDRYRIAVTEDYWAPRAPRYYEVQQAWYTAPDRQPQWRAWRASHQTEIAQFAPRGEVRRWSKDDDRAWKAYEKADRKAWQTEDKAWRKSDRQVDRQMAVAAPPPGPAFREDRRGGERRADRGPDQVRQASIEPQRERGNGRRERSERLEMATAAPRPSQDIRREAPRGPQGQAARAERRDQRGGQREIATATAKPRPAPDARRDEPRPPRAEAPERGRGGGRHEAQVATAQPPRPEAAPQRQHGGRPEARQAPAVAQAPPQPQREQGHGGGRAERGPERAAGPAPQAPSGQDTGGHAQGGGKPDKGHGKDK
jgi:hypothetical protein